MGNAKADFNSQEGTKADTMADIKAAYNVKAGAKADAMGAAEATYDSKVDDVKSTPIGFGQDFVRWKL